ncbi:MAG: hypothetical protein KGL39_22795 [Patescibacteria group bacterium]|nr:hypothetical protein [Patescibacteria group bacterium]
MKIKELIEELEKYNPDGQVEVDIIFPNRFPQDFSGKIQGVEPSGCGMINAVIIAN